MTKKVTKQKSGITIEINKNVADALGIDQKTDLEMIVVDDVLIVKPKSKSKAAQKRKTKLKEHIDNIMDEYEPVLKKLAKT